MRKVAETVGFSHRDFGLLVEALDDPTGELFFCPEIIEEEFAMSPEGGGKPFHGFDSGTHDLLTPEIKVHASPGRGGVIPEALEIFLEQIGANGLEVVAL